MPLHLLKFGLWILAQFGLISTAQVKHRLQCHRLAKRFRIRRCHWFKFTTAQRRLDFHQLQQWATVSQDLTLQLNALHQLRAYLKGHHGHTFRFASVVLFKTLLSTHHQTVQTYAKQQNIAFKNALTRFPVALALNQIINEDWFALLHGHKASLTHISLIGTDLTQAYLGHLNLSHALLDNADLSHADLTHTQLNHASLNQTQLHHANLNNVQLKQACFNDTNLYKASLVQANLQRSSGGNLNLQNAVLTKAKLQHVQFPHADLRWIHAEYLNLDGAQLHHANLNQANLDHAQLTFAQLNHANLSHAKLNQTDLDGIQLTGSNLRWTKLNASNLTGAHLQGIQGQNIQLIGAHLAYAQLQGAQLMLAQMQGAHCYATQLQGANLSAADLSGANVQAVALYGAQLKRTVLKGLHHAEDYPYQHQVALTQIKHRIKQQQNQSTDLNLLNNAFDPIGSEMFEQLKSIWQKNNLDGVLFNVSFDKLADAKPVFTPTQCGSYSTKKTLEILNMLSDC